MFTFQFPIPCFFGIFLSICVHVYVRHILRNKLFLIIVYKHTISFFVLCLKKEKWKYAVKYMEAYLCKIFWRCHIVSRNTIHHFPIIKWQNSSAPGDYTQEEELKHLCNSSQSLTWSSVIYRQTRKFKILQHYPTYIGGLARFIHVTMRLLILHIYFLHVSFLCRNKIFAPPPNCLNLILSIVTIFLFSATCLACLGKTSWMRSLNTCIFIR